MCGIVGIIGSNANQPSINKMLEVQHHRGPDFTDSYLEKKKIALGHNRLAIIDLSQEANQPMTDNSGRFTIVFNGEVYNYLELKEELKDKYNFKTHSDTEVLLAAYLVYGEKFLDKLNGMFAFVIYDHKSGEVFGARDRFGVKPLYYMMHEGSFYFSSEIKALEAAGLDLKANEKVWAEYLSFGSYGLPDESFWKDVKQLEAGHCFRYKNTLEIIRWYDFVEAVANVELGETLLSVQKSYEELLVESVNLRFRADVNVGFNLSGGLDSSTLLAMVNKLHPNNKNIKAYTFYTGDDRYDENFWVEKMLEQTNNPLEKVRLDVNCIPQMAKELNEVQYEPYGGIPTIAYYNLFKQARKDKTLVLLDGQGMDEQWAGYDYYTSNSNSVIQGVTTSPTRVNALANDFANLGSKNSYPTPFDNRLQNLQYRDLFYTKIPRALRFNDRVSMASSVELREPFLDYRLVEMAFAQPLEYKIREGQKKWMLRQIAQKHLSEEITTAPKRPLQTPQREWLGNELKGFVQEQIDVIGASSYSSWFKMDEIAKEWKSYLNGNQDNAFYIWQWVSAGMMIESRGK